MHEKYEKIITEVFEKFEQFTIDNVICNNEDACVVFKYNNVCLKMIIRNIHIPYIREIFIQVKKESVKNEILLPHYMESDESNYLLCPINKAEYVLSAYTLADIISLYLHQTYSLLTMGRKQKEKEYLKEFDFYWSNSNIDDKYIANIYLPEKKEASILEELDFKPKGQKCNCLIFPKDIVFNNIPKGTKKSAIYIPITYAEGLIPPYKNNKWTQKEILDILINPKIDRISEETYSFLKGVTVDTYEKIVVFSFELQDSIPMCFSGVIRFNNNKKDNIISKIQNDFKSFSPMYSSRMDLEYLNIRIGQECLEMPKVLLIGCGSVGSYLLPELINMGITNIDISDIEQFESGNSFRHYLGPTADGYKKTEMLKFWFEYNNPLVRIKEISNILTKEKSEIETLLSEYSIIIVAVGGTDIQREFNYLFAEMQIKSKIIFNWLDAEGKGAHAAFIDYNKKGCYNCLFYDNGLELPGNKISFTDGSEKLIGNGCGGTFTSYGNNVLIRNALLITYLLKKLLMNQVNENMVISIKNDFSILENSITMEPIINTEFFSESCDICGRVHKN